MARLRLTLFGGFEVRLVDGPPLRLPTRKCEALLAYLALRPGQRHPRDKLTALLWGESPDGQARSNLRYTLSAIRRVFAVTDGSGLVSEAHAIALDPTRVEVDVVRFEARVAEGTPEALAAAVALYRGDFLEGLSLDEPWFEEWLVTERERLRELAIETLARLVAWQSDAGDVDAALVTALRLLALDPCQEPVHRTLMRLYVRQGRRGAALRQYQACVDVLRRDLGAEPEADTRRLYEEMLRQAPGGSASAETRTPAAAHRVDPEVDGGEPPLVGRQAELARLERALDEAVAGRGGVLAVLGEAGIGKTRLLRALPGEARRRAVRSLVGRAYESEQVLAFGAWVDAFRAGGVFADDAIVTALDPACRAELGRILPELGVAAGGREGAESARRLFEAMSCVVTTLADREPLVVILEDLQWADEMSVRLLGFLGRRLRSLPVLMAVSACDEELEGAPVLRGVLDELARARRLTRVVVPPLARADTVTLLHALAPVRRAETALLGDQVWELSRGNPFMVVETARALGDGSLSAAATRLALPEGVRDLISRRLDRLSERARTLLSVAAVIGRAFDFALLQRAAGLPERDAAEGVEELVRKRLLHGVAEQFDITHDRIREVVRDALVAPKRRALHAAVGRELERLHADRLDDAADQLAYHYSRSAESGKAVEYLARFADQAARRYALGDAVSAVDEALGRVDELPGAERDRRHVELVLRQARSLSFLGRFRDALEVLLGERKRVMRVRHPLITGHYQFLLANTWSFLGDHERAAEAARHAIAETDRSGDAATRGRAYYVLAYECYWSGRPIEGLEHGQAAVGLLEKSGEQWWLGPAYFTVGVNHFLLGELDRALQCAAQIQALADRFGDERLQMLAAWSTGFLVANEGDVERGVRECRRGLELAHDPYNRAYTPGFLGYAHLANGDADTAMPLLEDAVTRSAECGVRQHEGWFMVFLSEAHLLKGALETAQALALRALEILGHVKFRYGVGLAQRALGRVACAGSAHAEAGARLGEALEIFAAIPARFEAARTRLDLAALAHARGDLEGARTQLDEARRIFTALAVPRWIERAEELGRRLAV